MEEPKDAVKSSGNYGTQDALERVEFLEQDEVTERVTEDEEVRHGLPLPRAPKVPSLDELSNDLDVPSELPASAPSALIQPRVLFSAHEDKSHAISGETSLETIRRLVDTRRVETALQQLSQHSYGVEGSLLRLRCLIQLRRFDDAAEECKSPELQDTAEAQLFLAQAPWRVHSDAYQAMLKLKALAEAWHETGPGVSFELRLQLLEVLSQVSLASGHGALGLQELQRALGRPGEEGRQLWSLLGRHHLSWGNLPAAKDAFENARSCVGEESTLLLNQGLLAMASSDYSAARNAFEAAAVATAALEEEVLAAENNLAVCKFYTKDLRGACERLEALVKKEPVRFLKPSILHNLASFYEFSQDASGKRRQLHMLAATTQLEDLDPQLFQAPHM